MSYVSKKGRQNVHSKRWANKQAKAQRIEYAKQRTAEIKAKRIEYKANTMELERKLRAKKEGRM